MMDGTNRTRVLTHAECEEAARRVACELMCWNVDGPPMALFGIPRGGIPAAYLVARYMGPRAHIADDPARADVFIDDVTDSGNTMQRWMARHKDARFCSLFTATPGTWLAFPWELTWEDDDNDTSAHDIVTRLLQRIGENPRRVGLVETPRRVIKAWEEMTRGYRQNPASVLKTFEDGAEGVDEVVLVRDIPFVSMCEHHMLPFMGVVHIGYIPDGRILGLSKFARLVDVFARRLQVQERLTQEIAHTLQNELQAKGVAVVVEARHTCMELRGVKRPGITTTTSCILGALREQAARAEFLTLIR